MHQAIQDLSSELKSMEINSIASTIHRATNNELLEDAQKGVQCLADDLVKSISRELSKDANTEERGLIMWLNPGVSRNIKPEPFLLRETIKYMRQNVNYESDGYDIYDLFDRDIDYQYNQIIKKTRGLGLSQMCTSKRLHIEPVIAELEQLLLTSPVNDATVDCHRLEQQMREIIATATKMFEDVKNNRIQATDCAGNYFYNDCASLDIFLFTFFLH